MMSMFLSKQFVRGSVDELKQVFGDSCFMQIVNSILDCRNLQKLLVNNETTPKNLVQFLSVLLCFHDQFFEPLVQSAVDRFVVTKPELIRITNFSYAGRTSCSRNELLFDVTNTILKKRPARQSISKF
jgi:hypothetical protein